MTKHLWWQKGVIYQIYPRSFQDSNGDGVGDLAGVVRRLDYLASTLGVDAIWLSPFYPSPMADFGYDVSNYTDVHPMFGTLADFDRLVREAHRRGLQVIVDLVPNHTSDQHPWFVESRSSRNNPKRDWYIWRDRRPDGSLPNNWLSVFGGPAWEWDQHTGQYYLHSFLKEQPDLNWQHPEVRAAMHGVIRFWLDRGVDGFRIDVAHLIGKDPALRDNPLNPPAPPAYYKRAARDAYDLQHHLYDRGYAPVVHALYREIRRLLDGYGAERPRAAIGETYISDLKEWASYYGAELDEMHMPFNFLLLFTPWEAASLRQLVGEVERALPPGAWPNYVIGNHDQPRVAQRLGPAKARQAALLLLTLRGTPTLYQGDDLGMTGVEIPPEQQQDPLGRRMPGHGRDACRTPMQWSAEPNAGFAPPSAQPWLPLQPDYAQINVEAELRDPTSFLNLHRRLLAYRHSSPALQWGSYAVVDNVPPDCFVYERKADGQTILVALNLSDREQKLELSGYAKGTLQVSTHMDRQGAVDLAGLVLRPWEGVVVEVSS